ncbi:hypothetical protein V8F06_000921 [Rhypophila decipiens]
MERCILEDLKAATQPLLKRDLDKVPTLQEADPEVQDGKRKRIAKKIGSWIKYIFVESSKPKKTAVFPAAPDTTLSPWLQNYQWNKQICPFYRLPPEVLRRIMEKTDGVTMQIVRRTYRIFPPIIDAIPEHVFVFPDPSDNIFCRPSGRSVYTLDRGGLLYAGRLGEFERLFCPSAKKRVAMGRKTIGDLLAGDETAKQCESCGVHQKSGQVRRTLEHFRKQSLWCSGCRKSHSLLLFSAAQRNDAIPNSQRICIGREGKIRLCSHEAISWDELERNVDDRENDWAKGGSLYQEIMRMCRHKSHQSPTSRWVRGHERSFVPVLRLHKQQGRSVGPWISGNFTWTSPVFDLDSKVPVTRQDIKDHLASRNDVFGHAPCPHVTHDDGQLLVPFESKYCVCFEDPDPLMLAEELPPAIFGEERHRCVDFATCCRWIATQTNNAVDSRRGHFMATTPADESSSNFTSLARGKELLNECVGDCHKYQCSICSAKYSWIRDGDCRVFLKFEKYLNLERQDPTSKQWLVLLDPESWGISHDEELRHVVWCPDEQCVTGSRWRRLIEVLYPDPAYLSDREHHQNKDTSCTVQ